ncbi:MAG: RsmD family RNA methyltransferase [Endomicrobiia bacterium]
MIKVISGEFKGRLLKVPKNIRPILAQIKKSLFDILTPYLKDSLFLDLYAGSGACGIEALSRGAKFCVFVEKEKNSLKILSENVVNLKCQDRCYIIKSDVLKDLIWIEKTKRVLKEKFNREDFDIIFIGAPYIEKKSFDNEKKYFLTNMSTPTIDLISNSKILDLKGILVVQHSKKENITTKKFFMFRQEMYGETIVSFFKY